jgi:hypothetical protein
VVSTSIIGGGNRRTRRKPPTCRNRCLSPLMLWVRLPLRARCDQVNFVSDLRQVGGFLRVLRYR